MTRPTKRKVFLLLVVLAILIYVFFPASPQDKPIPSLMPEPERMVGLRFDPSFFYSRGLTALELAEAQVAQWVKAGVNTIFFRVYDPAYGASYRTAFRYNKETDYGRQDLLGYMLKEARAKGLKVYAWLTPINHKEVWEAHPDWRMRRTNGDHYNTESLPYPLCPRHPGVQQWWIEFAKDLLDHYPDLAGIDMAEPVISWRKSEACHCALCKQGFKAEENAPDEAWSAYRAGPLNTLVLETFKLAHGRRKDTILTTVLPTDPEGNAFPFTELRDRTGLDLDEVLSSPARPKSISFEFMWQEWAVIYKDPKLFEPSWVKRAFSQANRLVRGRTRIIAHLELSDFQELTVGGKDLAKSLAAAIEAGAEGIEVYEASLIEKKNAWDSLKNLGHIMAVKKVLILHDREGRPDARKLGTLCGHFHTDVTFQQVTDYQAGQADQYSALFYISVDKQVEPPDSLIKDVKDTHLPVLWLNHHIDKLLAQSNRYGFKFLNHKEDPTFKTVVYKDTELVRGEPELNFVQVTHTDKADVLATIKSPEVTLPYAIHAGHLWYFADVPFFYAVEGGNYLVLADLLHDILGEQHKPKQLALIRLEDIHPLTPPEKLYQAGKLLYKHKAPFMVALVPFYVHPEQGQFISLSDRPEFVAAIKAMEKMGGTIVLHGITHQRTGESTADYEFWDTLNDTPLSDRTDANIKARVMRGLKECLKNGIHPLIWETPHYAGSLADYNVFSGIFSTACERRQSDDLIGTDQLYPYMIRKDLFGQMLLPENLGYVPLDDQRSEPILAAARRSKVVRDVTVGFFFHLFCNMDILEEIVQGLSGEGFQFPDVQTLPLSVTGTDFHLATTQAPLPDGKNLADAILMDRQKRIIWEGKTEDYPHARETANGLRFFPGKMEMEEKEQDVALRLSGGDGFLVKPLNVGIFAGREAFEQLAAFFRAVGVPCTRFDPAEDMSSFSNYLTMLVVTPEAAGQVSVSLRPQIMNFASQGGTVLTWGRSSLVESAGVTLLDKQATVAVIEDLNYGTTAKLPVAQAVPTITCKAHHEVVARDKDTETPVLYVVDVNEGRLLYSALPPITDPRHTPYPYFISMLQSHCMLAPLSGTKQLEVYFDPGLREHVAVEDLVKLWARNGVRIIHAGAWHQYPEWTFEYNHLINLAHQNGMLVYAWLVLPYVSPKFYGDHPQWHEKNYLGEDVDLDWRKASALTDPDCLAAVKKHLAEFLGTYAFDGVNIAGLHFGGSGPEKPESMSPFNAAACKQFEAEYGYNPKSLWDPASSHYWKRHPDALAQFNTWRASRTTHIHRQLLGFLKNLAGKQDLALVVSTLDSFTEPEKQANLGVDTLEIIKLKREIPFTLQLMDPGDKRPWGKARLASLMRDYGRHITPSDITFHLNLAHTMKGFSTEMLTGMALYRQLADTSPLPVAIYSEDNIPDADWPYLSKALASYAKVVMDSGQVSIQSPISVRLGLTTQKHLRPFMGDNQWTALGRHEILIPPGEHTLSFRTGDWSEDDETSLVDISCDLLTAAPITRGIQFSYNSAQQACAVLSKEPLDITVDGKSYEAPSTEGLRGHAFMLPAGKHVITVNTESWSSFALRIGSLLLSSGIVGVSVISLILVGILFILGRLRSRGMNGTANPPEKADT